MKKQEKIQLQRLAMQTGFGLSGYFLAKHLQKDATPYTLIGALTGAVLGTILIR
jgi:hypothetical protein